MHYKQLTRYQNVTSCKGQCQPRNREGMSGLTRRYRSIFIITLCFVINVTKQIGMPSGILSLKHSEGFTEAHEVTMFTPFISSLEHDPSTHGRIFQTGRRVPVQSVVCTSLIFYESLFCSSQEYFFIPIFFFSNITV